MKRWLISLLPLCVSTAVFAQFETKPKFQGKDADAFKEWVDERLVYDTQAKAEGVQGRVILGFTIEEDGTVDKVKVLRGIDPRLDAEAVRVVSSSPAWTPGTQGEKAIAVRFTFPVIFKSGISNPYPCDEFICEQTKHGPRLLRIYSVTHGSIVLSAPFSEIIIDPVMDLGGRKFQYGWFRPHGPAAILLTHEHHDHLNEQAIDYLCALDSTKAVQILGNRRAIEELGEGKVLENGDSVSVARGRIHVRAVPAYNTTKAHQKFHPKGNGNGYLIEIGDLVIYVAGDTENIPEMKKLGKVDIAFLPVNQPYTMTPEQCIKATKTISPKILIPYHMGDTDMTPVIKAFEGSDIRLILHEELR